MLLHWLVYTSVALFALAVLVRPSCCEVGQTVNYSVMMHWLAGGILLLALFWFICLLVGHKYCCIVCIGCPGWR